MKRSVILFVLIGLWLVLCATPGAARAALDKPALDVLGFSADGRFFAYRQSGIEPRSGQAYADLFVVDTTDDSWVVGTPVRVRRDEAQGGLPRALKALGLQSDRLMRRLGLNRAAAGVAFVSKELDQMWLTLPWSERALLRLVPRGDLAAPGCPVSVPMTRGRVRGFDLTVQRPTEVSVLHSDREVPRARGCALSYMFASGFMKPRGNEVVIAAVIAYREQTGAPGDNRLRYMAVTGVLKAPGDT